MSNRDLARSIIAEISAHDLSAQFRIEGPDNLFVAGKLTPELASMIKQHKADLINYLTIPPNAIGICRNGHKINWRCTEHGLWVCSCYFNRVLEEQEVKPIKHTLKDYWQQAI